MNNQNGYTFSWRSMVIVVWWIVVVGAGLFAARWVHLGLSKRSITICLPPLVIDTHIIQEFERASGIKVNVSYFDSPTALISKLAASRGQEYDLVFGDDHTIDTLRKQGLLQKFDRQCMPFFQSIDPSLIAIYADPDGVYNIPYYITLFGIAYNSDFFKQHGIVAERSWKTLLEPADVMRGRVCMTDDARQAFMVAAQYKYGSFDALSDPSKQRELISLLQQQKKGIALYSLERADYVLQTHNCVVAAISSSDFVRLSVKCPEIEFMIPKEGGFKNLESFAIMKNSSHQKEVYEFLQFVFQRDVIEYHMHKFGYTSVLKSVQRVPSFLHSLSKDTTIQFFKTPVSDSLFNEWWIEVLAF